MSDIRDGNSYRVRKLADGNCWMTENLRLVFAGNYVGKYNPSTNTITATTTQITPANSDVTSTWLPGHTTQLTTGVTWGNGSSSTAEQVNTPHSYYSNATQPSIDDTEAQIEGGYYNWITATAGIGNYDFVGGVSTQTICPKGFTLPTTTESAELVKAYIGTLDADVMKTKESTLKVGSFPFSASLAGFYGENAIRYHQSWARYSLKNAAERPLAAYALLFNPDGPYYLSPTDRPDAGRTLGQSIRCMAK